MDPVTKTYVSIGLVILALFEFISVMRIMGRKGGAGPAAKNLMRMHRLFGYVFLVYFIWISWICVDLMDRLASAGRPLDSRAVLHGFWAMIIFAVLLLKISFVRIYQKYKPYVPLLGMITAIGTLVLWGLAGWMFLIIM